jgi:hypothetical protein
VESGSRVGFREDGVSRGLWDSFGDVGVGEARERRKKEKEKKKKEKKKKKKKKEGVGRFIMPCIDLI